MKNLFMKRDFRAAHYINKKTTVQAVVLVFQRLVLLSVCSGNFFCIDYVRVESLWYNKKMTNF